MSSRAEKKKRADEAVAKVEPATENVVPIRPPQAQTVDVGTALAIMVDNQIRALAERLKTRDAARSPEERLGALQLIDGELNGLYSLLQTRANLGAITAQVNKYAEQFRPS